MQGEQLYPRIRSEKDHSDRRWHVRYDLAYDGGGETWWGYYRTRKGAKFSAFFNVKIRSWGGTAFLFDTKKVSDGTISDSVG